MPEVNYCGCRNMSAQRSQNKERGKKREHNNRQWNNVKSLCKQMAQLKVAFPLESKPDQTHHKASFSEWFLSLRSCCLPLPYPCVCLAKLRTTASTASFSTAGFPGAQRPAAPGPSPAPTPPYRLCSCSGGGGGGGPEQEDREAGEEGSSGAMGTVTPGRRDEERSVPVEPEPKPMPGCSRGGRRTESGRTEESIVPTSRLKSPGELEGDETAQETRLGSGECCIWDVSGPEGLFQSQLE